MLARDRRRGEKRSRFHRSAPCRGPSRIAARDPDVGGHGGRCIPARSACWRHRTRGSAAHRCLRLACERSASVGRSRSASFRLTSYPVPAIRERGPDAARGMSALGTDRPGGQKSARSASDRRASGTGVPVRHAQRFPSLALSTHGYAPRRAPAERCIRSTGRVLRECVSSQLTDAESALRVNPARAIGRMMRKYRRGQTKSRAKRTADDRMSARHSSCSS